MSSSTPVGFNIGAVARLTGIARERIRIWERRYEAVVPRRDAANNRLYSQEDIDRLVLIRRLVDVGHAIGQIARLPRAELEARQAASLPPARAAGGPERVLTLGPEAESLADQLRNWGIGAVDAVPDPSAAARWLAGNSTDLVIAACPTLTSQELAALIELQHAAPAAGVLLVYRFAPHRLLDQLARVGIRAVRAPLEATDLTSIAPPTATPRRTAPADHDYRRRQFTAADLSRLAAAEGQIACECPRHLVDLVRELQAFEDYTLACQVASPVDAALHREVYDVIARARALTEDALGIVAAEEELTRRGA